MEMVFTIYIYTMLFLAVGLWTLIAQETNRKKILWIPIILLALLAGIRGDNVGVDTAENMNILGFCAQGNFQYVRKEHLFYAIGGLLLRISGSYNVTFFAFATAIYVLIFYRLWDFRETASLPVAAVLFCLLFWGNSVNGLRQSIAMAMIFFGTRYLNQGKKGKLIFLGILLVGAGFHISVLTALAYYVFYYELKEKPTKKQVIIAVGAGAAVAAAGLLFCFTFYRSYMTRSEGIGLMRIARIVVLLVPCLALRVPAFCVSTEEAPCLREHSRKWLLVVAGVGCAMGLGAVLMAGIGRVAYYFRVFEIVYFATYLKKGTLKAPVRWAILALLIVYGGYQLYTYNGVVPYDIMLR